jgi:hypothetical protein
MEIRIVLTSHSYCKDERRNAMNQAHKLHATSMSLPPKVAFKEVFMM